MKIKAKYLIISILICLFSLTSVVYADDSTTRSIIGDYFNKVFDIELSDGKGLLETDADDKIRQEINNKIADGSIDKNYSLYDRFGGSVQFVPYYGETKISTSLLDRFYSDLLDPDKGFQLDKGIIKKIFESPAISNNVIYENRPDILSKENLEAGNLDPRVSAYIGINYIGGDAALGNIMLQISNGITTILGWLSGSGLYKSVNDIWQTVCENESFTSLLDSMVKFLLPLAMCVFVVVIANKAFKVAKGDINSTFREILQYSITTVISLGLIFSLMANPSSFSNFFTRIVTIFDDTLDKAIQIDASKVVKSDSTKNVRVAALWEKNVFIPWCNGMFGDEYDHLYTQYDETEGHEKMPQSHDDVKTAWDDGALKYNSKDLTGDIKIQVGPENYIRNWAALAWSTQSVYHLDAVINSDETEVEKDQEKNWPKATTTPMNDKIFVDNFRWLDAKLNISPEYYAPDNAIMDYSNSNSYSENFIKYGMNSLYMTLLLIPIGVLTFRKLANALQVVVYGFRLIYYSIMNIVMNKKYNLIDNIKKILKPLYDLFWWSMVIFLAVVAYTKLTGHTVVADLIWIMVGILLCKFRPIRTPRQVANMMNKAKRGIARTSKNVVEGINNKFKKK